MTQTVDIRDLEDRLSYYLRAVQEGKTVVVTKRGHAVARLVPAPTTEKDALPGELEERMWKLVAEGVLSWNGTKFQLPEPVGVNRGPGLLGDLVVENRE